MLRAQGLAPLTGGKLPRELTPVVARHFTAEVPEAKLKGLYDLGCFHRRARSPCATVIDSRQINLIEGALGIQGCAKGMTFAQFSALACIELREVQFDTPLADLAILQRIPQTLRTLIFVGRP